MKHATQNRESVQLQFETGGPSWAERAAYGGLRAVISPTGTAQHNLFIHSLCLYGASMALCRCNSGRRPLDVVDYGCGNGRFLSFFSKHGCCVTGVDVTPEMLDEARKIESQGKCTLKLTDGKTIPLPDQSVDLIWICAVFKYCVFPPGAACRGGATNSAGNGSATEDFKPSGNQLASEMYRVVRAGGIVVNYEMYVDSPPQAFAGAFEIAGFETEAVRVLHRYGGYEERFQTARIPLSFIPCLAGLSCRLRACFDSPQRLVRGFRDYLFVWRRPKVRA